MDAKRALETLIDGLRHTGMNRYEAAQWALERQRRLRAAMQRTREARATNGNGVHPPSSPNGPSQQEDF